MLSPLSGSASPALTEAESSASQSISLDQYFDLDSLVDQSPTQDKQLLFADSLEGFGPLASINPQSDDRETSELLR